MHHPFKLLMFLKSREGKFMTHLHLNETHWACVSSLSLQCQNRFRGFYFVAHFKRCLEAVNKIFGALVT